MKKAQPAPQRQAAPPPKPGKAVAVQKKTALPTFMAKKIAKDAGKGVSTAQEDNIVPLIYILQTNSPQVNKRDPKYIEGAEAGNIWLRNSADPIVDGEAGFLFQPCAFYKDFVEWIPRKKGGGYVGRHDSIPADAKLTEVEGDDGNVREQYVRKAKGHEGNEIVETRYHAGIVHLEDGSRLPYIMALTGSGHGFSRTWMTQMNAKVVDGVKAPSWACVYRLRTQFRQNPSGSWYMYEVVDGDWVESAEDYDAGAALHAAVTSGAKVAEAPDSESGADTDEV